MAKIELSDAGIAMAPVIALLHTACFSQAWDREAISRLLEMPGCGALLAQVGGREPEPAGFIIYRRGADKAEIITLGVAPGYRRQGIATHLLGRAAGLLRQQDVRAVFLEVAAENQGAGAFYRRQGFRAVGRRKGYYAGNEGDALVLRLVLPVT